MSVVRDDLPMVIARAALSRSDDEDQPVALLLQRSAIADVLGNTRAMTRGWLVYENGAPTFMGLKIIIAAPTDGDGISAWRFLSERELHARAERLRERERPGRIQWELHKATTIHEAANVLSALRVGESVTIDHMTHSKWGVNWLLYADVEEALRGNLMGSAYGCWPMRWTENGDLVVSRSKEGRRVYDRDGRPC